jgi:hypothetical protein
MSGRHRAYDIGDVDERRLAGGAVEGRDESVVAIFGVGRSLIVGEPREALDRASVDERRIVDLDPGGQAVDDEQFCVARLAAVAASASSRSIETNSKRRSEYDFARPVRPSNWGSPAATMVIGSCVWLALCSAMISAASWFSGTY